MHGVKPIIGVSASIERQMISVSKDNLEAVCAVGGIPMVLPYLERLDEMREITEVIDGLLLTGGGDINPFLFGEEPHPSLGSITPERDELEVMLVQTMLAKNKPILGLCRGCQILNIAAGGTMYQDIYSQIDHGLLQHSQNAPRDHATHYVFIEEGSLLRKITRHEKMAVNSYHHQALKQPAKGFVFSAKASDGVVEAVESQNHRFVLGVQWHPENMHRKDPISRGLFAAFIKACE
jgi:putative glutamine amidotransferase